MKAQLLSSMNISLCHLTLDTFVEKRPNHQSHDALFHRHSKDREASLGKDKSKHGLAAKTSISQNSGRNKNSSKKVGGSQRAAALEEDPTGCKRRKPNESGFHGRVKEYQSHESEEDYILLNFDSKELGMIRKFIAKESKLRLLSETWLPL